MFETAKTPLANLSLISRDKDNNWYIALYYVTLNLIWQYAMMSVNITEVTIFRITHNDLLYTVPMFTKRFEKLTI